MKEGLIFEENELRYYKHGELYHAGVIQVDGAIYYIDSHGRAVKGEHIVHGVMCNGILKRGTYTFGEDYKLVKGSYRPPRKRKKLIRKRHSSKTHHSSRAVNTAHIGVILVVCLVMLVFLSGMISIMLKDRPVVPDIEPATPTLNESPAEQTAPVVDALVLPTFTEDVLLCSESAKMLYDHTLDITQANMQEDPYRPMVFEYQMPGVDGILQLSESSSMTGAQEYILSKDAKSLEIHNLKTDTTYYYVVRVNGEDYPGSFHTAASNRFLSIPGIVNLRDIGGYQTLDGKTVKQGLLIRGTEIDGLVNSEYFIPTEALPQVADTFGFVHDMDLRGPETYPGQYRSRLGSDVTHKFYSSPGYGQIFDPVNHEALRQIFADLAEPANYPMYMHCTWGRDRTGTIVFLLQGLLNVAPEDMILEFKLTGYEASDIVDSTYMDVLIWGLDGYQGDTLQEKIISFLTTTVGVTDQQIASIQSIFLE